MKLSRSRGPPLGDVEIIIMVDTLPDDSAIMSILRYFVKRSQTRERRFLRLGCDVTNAFKD